MISEKIKNITNWLKQKLTASGEAITAIVYFDQTPIDNLQVGTLSFFIERTEETSENIADQIYYANIRLAVKFDDSGNKINDKNNQVLKILEKNKVITDIINSDANLNDEAITSEVLSSRAILAVDANISYAEVQIKFYI